MRISMAVIFLHELQGFDDEHVGDGGGYRIHGGTPSFSSRCMY